MPYIIDGHNLIHYLDDIDLDDPNDEAELVIKLRGFCARKRKKCVVIFDEGLPGGTSSLSTPSVKVVFASSRQSNADSIIRERIRYEPDVKGWIVVSSDNEILDEARDVGMRGMKCSQFAEMLMKPEKEKLHRGLQENVMVSPKEVEEGLAMFGVQDETDESDIQLPEIQGEAPIERIEKSNPAPHPQVKLTPETPKQPKQLPDIQAGNSTAGRVAQSDNEIEEWLDIFGEEAQREPTEKAQKIMPEPKNKPRIKPAATAEEAPAGEHLKASEATLSENSVDAWMKVFGAKDKSREATDPAPQRSDPKKQGRYKNKDGKREPSVHKRMATSEEIYLNSGEVDAWMDVFGISDEDDN